MDRLRAVVYGTVLLLIIGWVLTVGKTIFVPAVLGAVIVYVIVGLAHVLGRVPVAGRWLPLQLRYLFSMAVIALAFFLLAYLIAANKERAMLLAPQYQQSLLAAIQSIAVFFGVETEPTWATLRQELMAQINLQRLFGSLLASLGSILVTFVVVFLYATFLLVERAAFETKLANLSDDPKRVARIREVIETINRRIGSYLALKTLLSILLGAVSWVIMALFGLEFALLWAVLIAFLNFVPYIGSVLGVVFPVLMTIVQFGDFATILWMLLALTRGAVRHRQLPRPLRDGQLAEPEPLCHPHQPGGVVRVVGHSRRLSCGADHRHHHHRLLGIPGYAADCRAAVQERAHLSAGAAHGQPVQGHLRAGQGRGPELGRRPRAEHGCGAGLLHHLLDRAAAADRHRHRRLRLRRGGCAGRDLRTAGGHARQHRCCRGAGAAGKRQPAQPAA